MAIEPIPLRQVDPVDHSARGLTPIGESPSVTGTFSRPIFNPGFSFTRPPNFALKFPSMKAKNKKKGTKAANEHILEETTNIPAYRHDDNMANLHITSGQASTRGQGVDSMPPHSGQRHSSKVSYSHSESRDFLERIADGRDHMDPR